MHVRAVCSDLINHDLLYQGHSGPQDAARKTRPGGEDHPIVQCVASSAAHFMEARLSHVGRGNNKTPVGREGGWEACTHMHILLI